ncbi:MAG: NAD(P)/FAD-dependent oxidoreductase [Saprospiraceae bacterium]|nr:NAD(P)/FAD-dependent oxidoreductase [Saprospiraceae bacterium]MDZ4704005.1 NAD(P)/FAD-dependent oxidoreductase [Saprospiraceae bacterium]
MKINLPELDKKRVVVIGGGFAGIALVKKLADKNYQVVLIDRNNYHQFQPLFYQVAMAGLEPSSIVFPLRKLFRKKANTFIRMTEVEGIDPAKKQLLTQLGIVNYDYLVLATGAETNFFGNAQIAEKAIPMKSVSEALYLRNHILADYEKSLSIEDYEERQSYLDIVVVGGGPTGVEVAGSLAEMKKYILPKDYPELQIEEVDIYLIEGNNELLTGMSDSASRKALQFLTDLDVKIMLGKRVTGYDGKQVTLNDGMTIAAKKVIWAAGITGKAPVGLSADCKGPGGRILVDRHSKVKGYEDIFAIGDIALMTDENTSKGHPQLAQVAMQQGKNLAENFIRMDGGKALKPFKYRDLGSMATIGRNRAVVDLPHIKFQGAFAWFVWLFVHLFSILGVKNKVFVFLNWLWGYFTYDQSLRLIIRPKLNKVDMSSDNTPIPK